MAEIVRTGLCRSQLDKIRAGRGRNVRKGDLVAIRVFRFDKLATPCVEESARVALDEKAAVDVRLTPFVVSHHRSVPLHLRDEKLFPTRARRIQQESGLSLHPGRGAAVGRAHGMLVRREKGVARQIGERHQVGFHVQLRVEEDGSAIAKQEVWHELRDLAEFAIRQGEGVIGPPMDDHGHTFARIHDALLGDKEEGTLVGRGRRSDERYVARHRDRRVREDRAVFDGSLGFAVCLGVHEFHLSDRPFQIRAPAFTTPLARTACPMPWRVASSMDDAILELRMQPGESTDSYTLRRRERTQN